MTTTTTTLPTHLNAAWGWIDMASEWTEALIGGEEYIAACMENAATVDDGADVTASDLADAIEWERARRTVVSGPDRNDVVRQLEGLLGSEGSTELAERIYYAFGGRYLMAARGCVISFTEAQWDAAVSSQGREPGRSPSAPSIRVPTAAYAIAKLHLAGIEGGLKGVVRALQAGMDIDAAAGLDDSWTLPDGVSVDEVKAAVRALALGATQ